MKKGDAKMNETIKQIKNRKSMRMFTDKPIAAEKKQIILNAALQAPTAGNMILYSIIDITDQNIKEELAILCDDQPFIAKAPLVLVFVADYKRWFDAFELAGCQPRKPEIADILLAHGDALIAAQNTVVAADSMDLGSCYIGDILENKEKICELLDLPDYVMPATMAVYGYPTQPHINRKKPNRFDVKYIVKENRYTALDKEDHIQMHGEKDEKVYDQEAYEKMMKAFCDRKYMSDFAFEMNRSVRAYFEEYMK